MTATDGQVRFGQLQLNGNFATMNVGSDEETRGSDIRQMPGNGTQVEATGESKEVNKCGVDKEINGLQTILTQLNGAQNTPLLQPLLLVLDRRTGVVNGKNIQLVGHPLSGLPLVRSGISEEVKVGKEVVTVGSDISQILGSGIRERIAGQSEDRNRCGDEMEINGDWNKWKVD